MAPIYWEKLNFEGQKEQLARHPIAIWPIGGCISKGDELPLDFPRQCVRRLSDTISARTGWPIWEPLESGVSLDLGIAGHFPATLLQLAIEELQDARKAGFSRVWILSGARENTFALECARQTMKRSFPAFRSSVHVIWDVAPALENADAKMELARYFEGRSEEGAKIWESLAEAWIEWLEGAR